MKGRGFRRYERKSAAELRPYEDGDDMDGVSVSQADRKAGSPKPGDMIARNPDDHSDMWLVARRFFKKNYVSEAGGSGYTAAFTHPDPIDPNDIQRQRTQSRAGNYPYDSPTSYGSPIGTDMGGAAYQRSPDATPPRPQHRKASDEMPYGQYGVAWEQLESMLGTYTPGEQADDAFSLGYGSHGRMGEESDELDIGLEVGPMDLRGMFRQVDRDVHDDSLSTLLSLLSPDGGEDVCDDDTYDDTGWADRVYAPGAKDDQA